MPSGRNRFFLYDLQNDSVILSGLVAHGSCDNGFQIEATFSNTSTAGAAAPANSELAIAIIEDLVWHIHYTDLIHLIVRLMKELLFYTKFFFPISK